TSYGQLLGVLLIAGLAAGLLMPNMSNWILEMTAPSIRGKAVGLMTSMIFLGQFLSPFVSNPLKQAFGITTAIQYIGIASMLLSALFIIFHKPLSTPTAPLQVAGQRRG
ncbi:MAG: MFS transporter, partial [Bacteroidota bacterium]